MKRFEVSSEKALSYYWKWQDILGFDLGVETIYVRSSWAHSAFYIGSKHISLSSKIESKYDLESTLLHEIFHSIYATYSIPSKYLQAFKINKKRREVDQALRSYNGELNDVKPPPGEVSFYGSIHWEESASEIFSALVLNNFKLKGKIYFDDNVFDLEKDRILKRRFRAMMKIIDFLRQQHGEDS